LWSPVVVWMAVIFLVSSMSSPPPPPAGLTTRAEHVFAYAVLSVLAVRAFAGAHWAGVTIVTATLAIVLAGAYGVTDEWHQSFVPGRHPEAADVAADFAGALLGAMGVWALKTMKQAK
jgi:VanZ family protein